MEVSAAVHKIIKYTTYKVLFFFTSGGGVDEVLVILSLIKQIIKDVNLMCISLSVKHRETFGESRMSLPNMSVTISNMYIYLHTHLTHNC